MLTMFKQLASLVPTPAASKVTLFVSDTGIPSYKDDAGLVTPMSGQPIPAAYIDGLKMEYVAAGQMRFTSGSAYIPSLGRALPLPSALTKTLTLAASTWYHAYLYSNAGTADVEAVTTVPDTPYSGTARAKTGDTSRRYIGSFRTDSSSAIKAFTHMQGSGEVLYSNNTDFVVANGVAGVSTDVDCSAVIPVTGTAAKCLMGNANTTMNVFYGTANAGPVTTTSFAGVIPPNNNLSPDIPLSSSQRFTYRLDTTGGANGLYARVYGYKFER